MSENEEGRRSPSPIAGPSRSPLVASNDVLPAPTLSPHPATSSSSKLPSQLSKPSANDLSTGWHRFMSLLNELSPTQRLSFTAEILTLESYLAGRLKREAAQLDGMINPQLAASIMSTNTEDSTTISNVEEVEKSVDELLRSVGLNRLYEDELARTKRESREESRAASRSKVVHIECVRLLSLRMC